LQPASIGGWTSASTTLIQFGEEALSQRRLEEAVDAARECGFAALWPLADEREQLEPVASNVIPQVAGAER
jgi:hypothetical protein